MTQAKEKTAKRWFQTFKGGENKESIYVETSTKDYSDVLGAWLPKSKIKILNRKFGFGGSRTIEIEFPLSLLHLFKSIYPVKDIVDNHDGTYTFTHLGKRVTSSRDTMEALKKIRE